MKYCEKRQQTVEVAVRVNCDLCAGEKQNPHARSWNDPCDWIVNSVEISHEVGEASMDGGSGERLELEICPTCFKEKVLPALRQLGLKREYEPYDW